MSIASTTNPTINGPFELAIKGAMGGSPTFNWGAGTLNANVDFSQVGSGGTLTINGSDVTVGGALTDNATLNWSSANITVNDRIVISGQSTFNIQTANAQSILGSGDIFNNGTIQKTGANTTTITPDYHNQSSGAQLIVNSGKLAFQGSVYIIGASSVILNTGNISSVKTIINSGSISGVGTISVSSNSDLANYGIVIPGANGGPGTLTIIGTYTQESAGTLEINIDASGDYGILLVQGTVTLAGNLNVNKDPNYQPPVGTTLKFLEPLTK